MARRKEGLHICLQKSKPLYVCSGGAGDSHAVEAAKQRAQKAVLENGEMSIAAVFAAELTVSHAWWCSLNHFSWVIVLPGPSCCYFFQFLYLDHGICPSAISSGRVPFYSPVFIYLLHLKASNDAIC